MRTPIFAVALLTLTALPLRASTETSAEPEATWTYPAEADHLLFEARRIIGWHREDPSDPGQGPRLESAKYRTYRIFGNGRLVIEPPYFVGDLRPLESAAIEQFLRSIDRVLDLPAAQTSDVPPEHGEFIALHLSHYATADWQVAINYLDALVVENLELIFRELSILGQWTVASSGLAYWFSGNPQPSICHAEFRLEHGLGDEPTLWCEWQHSQPSTYRGKPGEEANRDARQDLRERLRQRLRALPRGLQEQNTREDEP